MESLVSKRTPPSDGSAGEGRKAPSAAHKALIARNLRLAFGEVASEPTPKRFLDLLDQLDKKDSGGSQ